MGKVQSLEGEIRRQQNDIENQTFPDYCFCVKNRLNFKCFFVLLFGLAALLSGIFLILPFVSQKSGFDAKQTLKLSASVQGSFRLQMSVSDLVPYIKQLESDITEEIGMPDTKVAILSMHKSWNTPNCTTVVYGFLSEPINTHIIPVSLAVLKSSLIDLFLQQANLTLTKSLFGQPSNYEILKCPGGITVNPTIYTSISQKPQTMFNFTLYDTLSDLQANFTQFKDELKRGLHLNYIEDIYVQITNHAGSTIAPPVIVEASVMSNLGNLEPQRLKQLAQTLKGSPSKNLGISDSIFGRVKSVSLSSLMEDTLDSGPPIPSPSPSPGPSNSPLPANSPAPLPKTARSPLSSNCEGSLPISPTPSVTVAHSPHPSPGQDLVIPPSPSPISSSKSITPASSPCSPATGSPSISLAPHLSPEGPPVPVVSCGSRPRPKDANSQGSSSPSPSPSATTSTAYPFYKENFLLGFAAVLVFHLLCS